MAWGVQIVNKNLGTLDTRDDIFAISQKCGGWAYLFHNCGKRKNTAGHHCSSKY